MERLVVLGTGNALATACYNTCFALENDQGIVLVDAGGGNGILAQIKKADLKWDRIRHLIVTHEHCDHLLGVVWVFRKIATMIKAEQYTQDFHIWCHAKLEQTIRLICESTLQKKFVDLINQRIFFHVVSDGTEGVLLGWNFTFFDIHSTKALQYGFCMWLSNGQKVTCLGDEPYNTACKQWVENTSTLLCEAFCLYEDREKFKPYEKHHSTVKDACLLAQQLNIPRLIIWHTEDENYLVRQEKYLAEGRQYYTGSLYVPYDLDVLDLAFDA